MTEIDLRLEDTRALTDKLPDQKTYKRLQDDLRIAQLQLQEANDTLNGGITNRNMGWIRQTYVVNDSDSLDSSYPMYVHFRILDETLKVVSVKVSYWIGKYRAYSKASAAGGGTAPTSSSVSTPSGGGATSGSGGGQTSGADDYDHFHLVSLTNDADTTYPVYAKSISGFWQLISNTGAYRSLSSTGSPNQNHRHSVAAHQHSTPAHTHPAHSHTITVPDHTHDADYGIYEEDTTPTIRFSVSEDNGSTYSKTFGNVAVDLEQIDVSSTITRLGGKILKMEASTRCRLTVQVEVKVDISVR